VNLDTVPFSPAALRALDLDPSLRDRMVTGGDDYEILCCVPEAALADLHRAGEAAGIPLCLIGEVLAGETRPVFLDGGLARDFGTGSFSHFR
jgi:thiamine-monophosphate kinase